MKPPSNLEPPPYTAEPLPQPPSVLQPSSQANQPPPPRPPPPYSANPIYTSVSVFPTAVAQEPVVRFGKYPQRICCPGCHMMVTTKAIYESGCLTWLSCFLTFILGGFICCCLIPFCCKACQDVRHICPECGATVGLFKRL